MTVSSAVRIALWSIVFFWAGMLLRSTNTWQTWVGQDAPPPRLISDALPPIRGSATPLIAPDSATAILVVAADCPACRTQAPDYVQVEQALSGTRTGLRVVVSGEQGAVSQYAPLLSIDAPILWDEQSKVADALSVHVVPSLYVFDHHRQIVQSYTPLFMSDSVFQDLRDRLFSGTRGALGNDAALASP